MPAILSCNVQGVCTVKGMPLISQSDERLKLSAFMPAGKVTADCYDASICTVANAALANRDKTRLGNPSRRTLEFDSMQASTVQGTSIPREINQLAWQCKPAGTDKAFYFTEVLLDFDETAVPPPYSGASRVLKTSPDGVTFREWMTPATTFLTNDYVRDLLEHDFIPMLGFHWVNPIATKRWDGWSVRLQAQSTHKVVVSGFRPGAFPLRINDVGTGTVMWARIVSGLGEHPLGHVDAKGSAVTELDWGGLPSRLLLEYEGENDPAVVKVIGQIDALSLDWTAPAQAFQVTWGKGWTHLVPFTTGNVPAAPAFIAYNAATGGIHLDRPIPTGSQSLLSATIAKGYTQLAVYSFEGHAHLLAHDGVSGKTGFYAIADDLGGSNLAVQKEYQWGANVFTQIVPFSLNGLPHVAVYGAATGELHLDNLTAKEFGIRAILAWRKNLSSIISFYLNGAPHLLGVNAADGTVAIARLSGSGAIAGKGETDNLFMDEIWSHTWAKGWSLAAVPAQGLPHFVAYNSVTGDLHFNRIRPHGRGADILSIGKIAPGFTSLMGTRVGNETRVLLYSTGSGSMVMLRAIPF